MFDAIEIATEAVVPKGMPHNISGTNRRVTVYVDPEHGEFTSVEVIRDSLCRYLHEHARGLERNENVEVQTVKGVSIMTEIACTYVNVSLPKSRIVYTLPYIAYLVQCSAVQCSRRFACGLLYNNS